MGWRRSTDLHGDDSWRDSVYQYLLGPESNSNDDRTRPSRTSDDTTHEEENALMKCPGTVIRVGRHAVAFAIGRSFAEEKDRCFPSSFEDYKKNICWICARGNPEWDLWVSCRHLFCKDCSREMLERNMPCPLCRIASSVVQRGLAFEPS